MQTTFEFEQGIAAITDAHVASRIRDLAAKVGEREAVILLQDALRELFTYKMAPPRDGRLTFHIARMVNDCPSSELLKRLNASLRG